MKNTRARSPRHVAMPRTARCIWTASLLLGSGACTGLLGDFDVGSVPGAADDAGGSGLDAKAPFTDAAKDAIATGDASGDAESDGPALAVPGAPSGVTAAAIPVVTSVATLAGSGVTGSADGAGGSATFSEPHGVAVDTAGNVYVADTANHKIRKVSAAGVVTTLAGSGTGKFADGTGAAASFFIPLGVAVNAAGVVYVADGGNNRLRKVTPGGVVTTLAGADAGDFVDGAASVARFNGPGGVALDGLGNVFVADQTNQRIRLVSSAGFVTTLAGSGTNTFADGTGAAAGFSYPSALAVNGSNVWIADSNNNRIRKLVATGAVTTLAGNTARDPFADGIGGAATFAGPQGVALDAADVAYVTDQGHNRIRKVTPAGAVTTLAGSGTGAFADGAAATASFNSPYGVAVDTARNVYVGDTNNNRIRKVTSAGIQQLKVSWTAPTVTGGSAITGYTATASAAGFAPQTCISAAATSCTISGLTSGVAYDVVASATNAAGTGAASGPAIATPN